MLELLKTFEEFIAPFKQESGWGRSYDVFNMLFDVEGIESNEGGYMYLLTHQQARR